MAWSDEARKASIEARRRKAAMKPKNRQRLSQVYRLEKQIKRSPHYEDRLEYQPRDFQGMYGIDRAQGRLLYSRLQSDLRKQRAAYMKKLKVTKAKG